MKSTSIKTLNAKETAIINVLNKPLPFKGSGKMYKTTPDGESGRNMYYTTSAGDVKEILKVIDSKRPEIKNIILDDVGFIMATEFFEKANVQGFNKFTQLAKNFQSILDTAKSLRNDLNVVFMFHEEMTDNNESKKIKTVGKLLDNQYDPLATVSIALFTSVDYSKDGNILKPNYSFITNRTINNKGVEIPAKSPEGMFEDMMIPNDLNYVIKMANEFYYG